MAIVYDALNRMVSYASGTGAEAVNREYAYDAAGRRVGEYDPATGDARYYVWYGERVYEEYENGLLPSNLTASYVYGVELDEVVAKRHHDATPFDIFYHTDDLNTVTALSDASGAVVAAYDYEDYGSFTAVSDAAWDRLQPNAAVINTRHFQGKDFDAATGWHYYRHRWADPETGRFTTRDPLGVWADVLHLGNGYSFLNNNPWSLVDPFGLKAGSNKFDWWGEVFSPMLVGRDLLEFGKGFFIDGLGGSVMGLYSMIANFDEFVAGIRGFAAALYDDPRAVLGGMYNDFVDSLDDPRALGMYTFSAMATVAGGYGAAAVGNAVKSGRAGKYLSELARRLDDDRGFALMLPGSAGGRMIQHHIFNAFRGRRPKSAKYREFFEKHGIKVDDFVVDLPDDFHREWVHRKGKDWTREWKKWIDENPRASTKEVYQQGGRMMDDYGIGHLEIKKYGDK